MTGRRGHDWCGLFLIALAYWDWALLLGLIVAILLAATSAVPR